MTGGNEARSRHRVQVRFAGTYYFVYVIDSLISSRRIISDGFYDHFNDSLEAYAAPFQRWTALHIYIEFVLRHLLNDDFLRASGIRYVPTGRCSSQFCTARSAHLLVIDLMKAHDLELPELALELDQWVESGCHSCPEHSTEMTGPDFDSWEEVLDPEYDQMLEGLAEELFFVLFANRTFLYRFNCHIAGLVGSTGAEGWSSEADMFQQGSDGQTRLRRTRIPNWAKRAVFFRDRGRCCKCERDLGAGYSPENNAQYDHIVPLADSGLNDVTNLQLLCRECNNAKSDDLVLPSQVYDRWYSVNYDAQPRTYPTLERIVLGLAAQEDLEPTDGNEAGR